MPRLLPALLFALTAAPAVAADPPAGFFFKPGDRVMFLGDSITEQYQYSTDIELYLTTRFPEWHCTFLNAGIGGDTANGGAGRFKDHVLAEKPTALTIDFGMNDGGYGGFNPQSNKTYVDKTMAMLDAAKKAGVRVALISPNAVDPRPRPNLATYFETQKQFYAPLKAIAEKAGVPFVDQYAVTRTDLEQLSKDDPKAAKVNPFPDGVHTNGQGGLLMAHTILVGLHAPAVVSEATIEVGHPGAPGASLRSAKGCTIGADVSGTPDGVKFTRTDAALPLPVQKDWLPLLPYVHDLKDLNWYGLTVKGLKPGGYAVTVDGTEVGRYTADQLAAGVNLGTVTTGPVWEQGNEVLKAINAKNNVVHQRFRGVVMTTLPAADWLKDLAPAFAERKREELAARMAKVDAAQAKIYELARPKPRVFEVKPAK